MPGFSWCGELITEHKEELYDSEERYDSKEELYASELTSTGSSDGADGGRERAKYKHQRHHCRGGAEDDL